ncbi:MAG: zinc ribbon domain-containing protein [Blastocatellia bacterium]
MQTSKCSNCGADIDYATKFCRQCGRPVDPSEWTTRKLEEPSRFESPTRPANSWSTAPTYLPPDAMPPQVAATGSIESTGQKKTVVALAAVIAVLVIVLSALAIFLFVRQADQIPRAMTPPTVPSTPRAPEAPIPPSASSISGELIYPGAKVTMDMSGGSKGRVIKLSTPDGVDTVTDWYINKIGSAKQVRIPGGSTVLSGNGIAVVITVEGSETSIILTQK